MSARFCRLVAPLALPLILAAPAVTAEDEGHVARAGNLELIHAWARATDGPEGQVFMEIHNLGSADDELLGARFDGARRVEIHGATFEGGQAGAAEVGPMKIPGGGRFDLEPSGVFLKLIGLDAPLQQGGHIDMVVTFREAGEAEIEVAVEAAGATQHSHAGHAH